MPRLDGTGPLGRRRGGAGRRLGAGRGRMGSAMFQGQGRKLDGTGPLGQGPRTGRGLGNCAVPDKK